MREEQKERALLLGVKLNDGEDFKKSMEELAALSEACGMEVVGTITQNMDRQPHASHPSDRSFDNDGALLSDIQTFHFECYFITLLFSLQGHPFLVLPRSYPERT